MTWIQLYNGGKFDFANPDPGEISIIDIARSLSHQCRFSGHTVFHYSVAQHSVLVSQNVSPKNAMAGLLHDAAEAILCDIPRPAKVMLPDYKHLEVLVESIILPALGLTDGIPEEVRLADQRILVDEKHAVMYPSTHQWGLTGVTPLGVSIQRMTPDDAMLMFLKRYEELGGTL